jgi:hypothetical protein
MHAALTLTLHYVNSLIPMATHRTHRATHRFGANQQKQNRMGAK